MTLLRRCLLIAGLGLVVPITNCTLITDVDRGLIGADTDAAGGTGGTGPDAPTTNGENAQDLELDDADTDAND